MSKNDTPEARARERLWTASQSEESLYLNPEEARALWESILSDAHRRIKAEYTLKQVRELLEKVSEHVDVGRG